ncbi:replication fork protection component Swi3-domain-containing protein [Chaetomidium leptoderma]|uniref:Chromosome segregation in meiosis protein n=1 Tax=Chaetomidium leptoderma TaxID=669021 RepID=A0AAN6VE62_9PEZI|nr:replication fork protection component Swi3-domain-containing protein [Chaetomidium leptoderma]
MPSKAASKPADSANPGKGSSTFVNDYLADWDDDDPFRSPSPEPAKNDKEKEKSKDVLGIEKQLDLKRKPRAPRVKLDDTRLLSDKGIPKLRKMGPKLKLKGKGHEFSDAARLLSFYQDWLDDLFPKATFLDALAMVEKTGHKTTMRNARLQWIDEGKPRATAADDEEDYRIHQGPFGPQQSDRVAPVFENAAQAARERAKTPEAEDLFGDDIYNATPRRDAGSTAPARQVVNGDVPDDDNLDALMAEAEGESAGRTQQSAPLGSLFGNGSRSAAPRPGPSPDDDDDDLDALMGEAAAEVDAAARPSNDTEKASSARADTGPQTSGFDDDEEAMAEMDGLW